MVSLLNTIDTQHEDMIHDVQVDYYGIRMATCSSDWSVKVFDIRNGQQTLIDTLNGHEGPVWQVSWSHPKFGNLIASCSYDRKVIIWKESPNGKWAKIYEHSNHDSSVNSVCWAPHEWGLVLACGSSDGHVSTLTHTGDGNWEVKKFKAHSVGCNAVSWAPAVVPGSLVDQPSPRKPTVAKRLVTGGCDNLVKIWREEEDQWREEQVLEGHSDWVRDVAWAPSSGLPHSNVASCSQDGRVIIWTSLASDPTNWTSKELNKFPDVVWHVSWSITGNILAVSGGDNKVSLWRETMEGQWACVSDVKEGQAQPPQVTTPEPPKQTPAAQPDQ